MSPATLARDAEVPVYLSRATGWPPSPWRAGHREAGGHAANHDGRAGVPGRSQGLPWDSRVGRLAVPTVLACRPGRAAVMILSQ
jgi:hypothetical protein